MKLKAKVFSMYKKMYALADESMSLRYEDNGVTITAIYGAGEVSFSIEYSYIVVTFLYGEPVEGILAELDNLINNK